MQRVLVHGVLRSSSVLAYRSDGWPRPLCFSVMEEHLKSNLCHAAVFEFAVALLQFSGGAMALWDALTDNPSLPVASATASFFNSMLVGALSIQERKSQCCTYLQFCSVTHVLAS